MIRFPPDVWTAIRKGFDHMQSTWQEETDHTLSLNAATMKNLLSYIKTAVIEYAANVMLPKTERDKPLKEEEDNDEDEDKHFVSLGHLIESRWSLDLIPEKIHSLMTREECRKRVVEVDTDEDGLEEIATDNGAAR